MTTKEADMLEWFQKWCHKKLFASFREQHSLSFSRRIQQFFAYFDTSRIPNINGAAASYFLQMSLHNGGLSAQHLSQFKKQQLIVWTMIDLRVWTQFLEYNSNKIQHSASAVQT